MRSRLWLCLCLLLASGRAQAEVRSGAYRGDGVDGRAIAVGFRPVVVLVKGSDSDVNDDLTSAVLRTDTMAADAAKPLKGDQPIQANLVQSLDANGFTVGSDRKVNAAGIVYYWVAFEADADLATGSFVGNGSTQSLGGLGFSPDYVVLLGTTARRAVQRPASAPSSYQFWAGSPHLDAVTSLDADGFTVAGSLFANETGATYHYAAWNAAEGKTVVGAYVGSGTDDRSIGTVGLEAEYAIARTSTGTEDAVQRMRAHSGDQSMDFRSTVQPNRIQSFESTGFLLGSDTRVNAFGQTYFYVAFGDCETCRSMTVSETATTVSAAAEDRFSVTFDETAGGGIQELYDLREDPGASIDLAGGATGVTALHDEGVQSGGVWYNLDNDSGARAHILEATPARTVVRQLARHTDGIGTVLGGPLTSVDYGVYASGRVALDWNRWNQSSSAVPHASVDRDLSVHRRAAAPLDAWAPFSQSGALGSQPGADDFLLAQIDSTPAAGAGARADLLHVLYADWAEADFAGTSSFPADEWQNLYWSDTTAGSFAAGSRSRWSALTYLRPTDLSGPSDRKATDRASDYRSPAVPVVTVGNGWFSASENTAPGDFFDEAEAAYGFTFDPLNGLDFTLDGSATQRFAPFFKIRGWRSLSPTPDVSLIATELAWRVTDPTGDLLPADDTSSADETHRVILRAPFLTRNGDEVRIKLRASGAQPLTLSGFTIAEVDAADDRDVVDATRTSVTFAGSGSLALPAGGTAWSDWIAFPVDEAKSYSVTFYVDALANGTSEWFGPAAQKFILLGDQTALTDWSGAAPAVSDRVDALEEVEVREALSLSSGSAYLSDLKPISRAHFASDVTWYSTAGSAGEIVSPDVGAAGAATGAVSYVPGRHGGAVHLDADGEYLSVPASQVLDTTGGAHELWYRPSYDFGTGPANDDDAIFGYWIDNQNYFYVFHEPYAGGPGDNDGINFDTRAGPATSNVTTGAGPAYPVWWRAGEWVHLRFTWDVAASRLEVYVNGVLAASGLYAGAPPLPPDDVLYIGERNRFGNRDNHARGTLDEITFFGSASSPSTLAHGGLTSDAREHLASSGRNAQLGFSGVDALSRGAYLFLGADSQFSGLNVDLAVNGAGVSPGALVWEYWSNASGWRSLEVPGFVDETESLTRQGAVYWPDLPDWDRYTVNGGPELYTVRVHLASGESYTTPPTESVFKTDVLLFQYCQTLTRVDQRFLFAVPPPTAVALVDFRAVPGDGRVALEWETASEVQNLGFHLYRAEMPDGPFERLTDSLVPGLGSSPEGAFYRYVDAGLENGVELYYLLEDVEATGRRRRHGPVSARPSADAERRLGGIGEDEFRPAIVYGEPEQNRLTVIARGRAGVVVELFIAGFHAEPLEDGTVRIRLPGLETGDDVSLPVARTWVRAPDGLAVELLRADGVRIDALALRPADTLTDEVIALEDGTVRRRRGPAPSRTAERDWSFARLVTVAHQGDDRKALAELSPFHWDDASGQLLLARRIVAKISFRNEERTSSSRRAPRGGEVVARLGAERAGLNAVEFDALKTFLKRRWSTADLQLSRLGEPVPYHVEPDNGIFGPGSTLYFVADDEDANPYGSERVYELVVGEPALDMERSSASPSGLPVRSYRHRVDREENRLYQAALVQAEDLWMWDAILSGSRKSYGVVVTDVAEEDAVFELRLQGGSDFPVHVDHHVRAHVNGVFVGETFWEGKLPETWSALVPAGVLVEGDNVLTIENVGDTGAAYSMVYLDGFSVTYSRRARALTSGLDGWWTASGLAVVEDASPGTVAVEMVNAVPRWVANRETSPDGSVRFRVEAGRRYLVASGEGIHRPVVRGASPAGELLGEAASYLVIGPRAYLDAAAPLLQHRRSRGLAVASVSTERVYEVLGHGERRPEAIQELISEAYHTWRSPGLRYVLLLGDGTYDFKDYLGTGVVNHVPPLMTRTRFMWTASDPHYGAVHGDDDLPDVAVGRLPAASVDELRVMIGKILEYELAPLPGVPRVAIVADNPDRAGDFEANARELALDSLAGREVDLLFLRALGVSGTRSAVRESFASGAGVLSYIGHGGIHLWASENLLDIHSVSRLPGGARWPIAISANCLNGYFHFPYFDSLSERLVEADGRGAIAAIAPSGLSWDAPSHRFHQALLRELSAGGHERLGDALLAAQKAYVDTGATTEVVSLYHLLGDPALEIGALFSR